MKNYEFAQIAYEAWCQAMDKIDPVPFSDLSDKEQDAWWQVASDVANEAIDQI